MLLYPVNQLSTNMPCYLLTGNLPFNAQCQVCEEECGTDPQLNDWWCCWCRWCAHNACIQNVAEVRGTASKMFWQ